MPPAGLPSGLGEDCPRVNHIISGAKGLGGAAVWDPVCVPRAAAWHDQHHGRALSSGSGWRILRAVMRQHHEPRGGTYKRSSRPHQIAYIVALRRSVALVACTCARAPVALWTAPALRSQIAPAHAPPSPLALCLRRNCSRASGGGLRYTILPPRRDAGAISHVHKMCMPRRLDAPA